MCRQDNPEDKLYLFQFPEPFPKFLPNPATSYAAKIEELKRQAVAAASVKAEVKPNGILKKAVTFDADGDVPMEDKPEGAGSGDEEKKPTKDKIAAREAKQAKAEAEARHKMIAEYERKENNRKAQGRIGTLVVTKSGRAKMVLSEDIVMDVSLALPLRCCPLLTKSSHAGHTGCRDHLCATARPPLPTRSTSPCTG